MWLTPGCAERAWVPGLRDGEETIYAVLPLFHAYGLTLCLTFAVSIGATLVLFPRFDVDQVLQAVGRRAPTFLPAVPPIYERLATSAREKGDVGALGKAETGLRAGLGQLFALAENYPQLKANDSFQHLQQRITGLENGIADRRELYNEAVNLNNVRIEQFPDVIIANLFGFKAAELLQFSEAEKADVNIKALFG